MFGIKQSHFLSLGTNFSVVSEAATLLGDAGYILLKSFKNGSNNTVFKLAPVC